MQNLHGTIAVVTGASRGAGRGISVALGAAGATVYVTGRSVRGALSADNTRGTIEDTADEVRRAGGQAVAVRCDFADEAEVAALFARVRAEQGRLDVLVNNAWAGNERYDGRTYADGSSYGTPFWKFGGERWSAMMDGGPRLHLTATRHAVPLMLERGRGLVVCTTFTDHGKFLGDLYYDLAKATIARLAFGMAQHLRPHRIACVGVSPGWMRTERVEAAHYDPEQTESVLYIGRAVAALAGASEVLARTGETLQVGDLAREFGFTDEDGRQPPPFVMPAWQPAG